MAAGYQYCAWYPAVHPKDPKQNGPPTAGYIGSASMLEAIQKVVRKLRQLNPDLTYGATPFWQP